VLVRPLPAAVSRRASRSFVVGTTLWRPSSSRSFLSRPEVCSYSSNQAIHQDCIAYGVEVVVDFVGHP